MLIVIWFFSLIVVIYIYSILIFCLSTFQPPHLRVKKIFVGGLKPETTDQQIREYFGSKYAPVGFDNSISTFCGHDFING